MAQCPFLSRTRTYAQDASGSPGIFVLMEREYSLSWIAESRYAGESMGPRFPEIEP